MKNGKTTDLKDHLRETEAALRQAAETMPVPEKTVPVLPETLSRHKVIDPWRITGRVAAVLTVFILLGGSTAAMANPALREAVISFLGGRDREEVPYDRLDSTEPSGGGADGKTEDTSVTAGSVTLLRTKALDQHFTATYLSSPDYLDTILTPSGTELFYTLDAAGRRTYYQLKDGALTADTPGVRTRKGSITFCGLPGVMDVNGDVSAGSVRYVEIPFTVTWQQWEQDILVLEDSLQRFALDSRFVETKDGTPPPDNHEGSFYARGIAGNTDQVVVYFVLDAQTCGYQYPFLFNIHTGEVWDPLAGVDLSAYDCITDLTISDDQRSASAMAGKDRASRRKISIDLATGRITEKREPAAPVEDVFLSSVTGEHTVFYITGTEECMEGYLYDERKGRSERLFHDAAWGLMWEEGTADTYVELTGGNYAVIYKEPENKVYLLNLSDGSRQLLKGIPVSRSIHFFWNPGYSMLSITRDGKWGTRRLAFLIPGTDHAWYFDRNPVKGIQEQSASWYGERGYLIRAWSEKRKRHYLYLYEYMP